MANIFLQNIQNTSLKRKMDPQEENKISSVELENSNCHDENDDQAQLEKGTTLFETSEEARKESLDTVYQKLSMY